MCSVASIMSNSLQSPGLQPARLLYPRGFSRQEYWSGLPCPPPGDLPKLGIEPVSLMSPALAGEFFITSATQVVCKSGWTAVKAFDKISLNNNQLMAYFTKIIFKLIFSAVQLLYNVLLVSSVKQSEQAIPICISPLLGISFPFLGHSRAELPMLYGKFSLSESRSVKSDSLQPCGLYSSN